MAESRTTRLCELEAEAGTGWDMSQDGRVRGEEKELRLTSADVTPSYVEVEREGTRLEEVTIPTKYGKVESRFPHQRKEYYLA